MGYGGRITDDFDRVLFNTYGDSWLGNKIFDAAFEFAPGYKVLKFGEITKYRQAIEDLKDDDHPSVFGMHANADLVFRSKQAKEVINVMMDIQPKDSGGGGGGPSREEQVLETASGLLEKMPAKFNPIEVVKRLDKLNGGGQPKPLNIHLKQEVDR